MFFIIDAIKIAFRGIVSNKGRAFLTMLGVIIGITSVIVIMAVGEGAQSLIVGEIKSLGSNLVGVLPGNTGEDQPPAAVMGIDRAASPCCARIRGFVHGGLPRGDHWCGGHPVFARR